MTHGTTFSDLAVFSETADGFNLPALTTLSASRHPTASSHPTDESQEGHYFRFRHSFPLFYAAAAAPSQGLRTLSLRRACDFISNFVPTPHGLNPLATVTSLTLDSCRITLEQAADVITACDSLEIFHMVFFHTIASHPEVDVRDSRVVLDAIRKHTATLRVLSLDNGRDPLVRSVEDAETLKGFAKLESLFVGLTMLGGEERFMLNDEHMFLWDDEETGRRAMQGDGFLAGMLPASVRRLHLTDSVGTPGVLENLWGVNTALARGELEELGEVAVYMNRDVAVECGDARASLAALGVTWIQRDGFRLLLRPANSPISEWV